MTSAAAPAKRLRGAVLATAITGLAVASGIIHLSLGAPIFILNGLGYLALAGVYVIAATVSHPVIVRFGWLPRVALFGYAAASIGAWLILGGSYWLGYLTKAIELALLVLLILDSYRVYGSIRGLIDHAAASLRWALAAVRR